MTDKTDRMAALAGEDRRGTAQALPKTSAEIPYPVPRQMGAVNWRGVMTLYLKEVQRFLKVPTQTVMAPVVTSLLFLAIFSLALGGAVRTVNGVQFVIFLGPGLIMMTMVQNAFANTSSSIIIGKLQGNIVDILMPPLSAGELTSAYVMAGVTRALMVGLAAVVGFLPFVPLQVHSLAAILFFAVAAALMLALLGVMTGLWADKFDQMAGVTNFVITPLAFLSGTFYSVERLPGMWHTVSQANPFFYMIDGFRFGFIGRSDSSVMVGVAVLIGVNLALWVLCHSLFARGYKLKS